MIGTTDGGRSSGNWSEFSSEDISEQEANELRRHDRNGRPLGSENFIEMVEKKLGRILHPQKPEPKKKEE